MKRITEDIPKVSLDRFLDFDLEDIYMFCAVNCIENPYIANYLKKRKQIEDDENTNEREDTSQYPPIISYDESGNEEELSIQPILSIRSSNRKVEPTHNVKKKNKRRSNNGRKVSLPNDVAPTTHCDDDNYYTIGAIHIFNDESDYTYDMKGPKHGEAMFDEDEIFENIFAEINVCPKLGDATFNEDDIFASQVLICKVVMMIACLLPMMIILMKVDLEECQLYLVMIPLSWKRFQSIMMRTKLLLMMIIVMKLML